MIPQLPDNLNRIILGIGLFLIGYGFYQFQHHDAAVKASGKTALDLAAVLDSIGLENRIQTLVANKRVANLMDRHGLAAPLSIDDNSFHVTTFAPIAVKTLKDSVLDVMIAYMHTSKTFESQKGRAERELLAVAGEIDVHTRAKWGHLSLALTGMIFFFLGGFGLAKDEYRKDALLMQQHRHSGHTRCQSCGKLFSAMVRFGRECEGTPSAAFCSGCYENGQFTEPDITFAEVEQRALKNVPRTLKEELELSQLLRRLERWRQDAYRE